MAILRNLEKHLVQIKNGGFITIVKKLKTLFYLLIQLPLYLVSTLFLIIIRLIKPWFLIRWSELRNARIGHIAFNSEYYSCKRDAKINTPSQRYIDIFYLAQKYNCNKQLIKMIKRSLLILPSFFLLPLQRINQFIPGGKLHEIENNSTLTDRDTHNIFHKYKPHINFTNAEELKGERILNEFGIPKNAKIVCLIVRDAAYLDRYSDNTLRNFNYHSYRNGDIDRYVLAAEELSKRGYYVFRMGVKVNKPLKTSDPKIIDYANLKMRSDFMDIYLGAKCTFCISTSCGFDEIPKVFRKPVAHIDAPIGYMHTETAKDLLLTKHHFNKKNNKKLTVSEIFSSNIALSLDTKEYEKNNVLLEENSPEEIKDLAIEMDERLNGIWKETEQDLLLQKKFWSIFQKNFEKLALNDPITNQIGYVKKLAKYSTKFLRDNQNWIQ